MRAIFEECTATRLGGVALPVHRLAALRVKLRIVFGEFDQPRLSKAARLKIAMQRLDRRIEAEGITDCRGHCRRPCEGCKLQCGLCIIRERFLAIHRDARLQCGGHAYRVHMVRRREDNKLEAVLTTQHLVEMGERTIDALLASKRLPLFQVGRDTRQEFAAGLRAECWNKSGTCPISRSDHPATHRLSAPDKADILSERWGADNIGRVAISPQEFALMVPVCEYRWSAFVGSITFDRRHTPGGAKPARKRTPYMVAQSDYFRPGFR